MGSRFSLSGFARQFGTDLRTLTCRRLRGGPSISARALALDRLAGALFLVCVAGLGAGAAHQTLPMSLLKVPIMTESAQAATGAPDPTVQELSALPPAKPLRSAEIRALQGRLEALGFNPGAIDGIAGRRTLDALNRYRATRNLGRVSTIDRPAATDLLD